MRERYGQIREIKNSGDAKQNSGINVKNFVGSLWGLNILGTTRLRDVADTVHSLGDQRHTYHKTEKDHRCPGLDHDRREHKEPQDDQAEATPACASRIRHGLLRLFRILVGFTAIPTSRTHSHTRTSGSDHCATHQSAHSSKCTYSHLMPLL